MNERNRTTGEQLASAEVESPGPVGEPSLWEQVRGTFRGRNGWLMVLVAVSTTAFWVFAVVSAVCFFRAEGVREMIAWAGGFGLGLSAVIAGRIFFWTELHKNAIVREVRRVELQIARLASRLDRRD
jgi:hypothetical protein